MRPRTQRVLDAAIGVVGTSGIRALTHRAVDAAAGLPAGSTSNLYRTREALLRAMMTHLIDTEIAGWDRLVANAPPSTVDEVADMLAATVAMLTGPLRVLSLARYALFLEASREPALRDQIGRGAARVAAVGLQWLTIAGSHDPAAHASILMAHLDGLVLHQLSFPEARFGTDGGRDVATELRTLLRALLGE